MTNHQFDETHFEGGSLKTPIGSLFGHDMKNIHNVAQSHIYKVAKSSSRQPMQCKFQAKKECCCTLFSPCNCCSCRCKNDEETFQVFVNLVINSISEVFLKSKSPRNLFQLYKFCHWFYCTSSQFSSSLVQTGKIKKDHPDITHQLLNLPLTAESTGE